VTSGTPDLAYPSVLEAIDRLDRERRRLLRELWDRATPIPVPHPPLRRA
jgi:hypothetical protein